MGILEPCLTLNFILLLGSSSIYNVFIKVFYRCLYEERVNFLYLLLLVLVYVTLRGIIYILLLCLIDVLWFRKFFSSLPFQSSYRITVIETRHLSVPPKHSSVHESWVRSGDPKFYGNSSYSVCPRRTLFRGVYVSRVGCLPLESRFKRSIGPLVNLIRISVSQL